MAEKLNLGIIGMSDGNGHPYSWSAIFNGYDPDIMAGCPFPAIPAYLAEQNFPEDGLASLGEVTHVWTQDSDLSRDIAYSAKIRTVVPAAEEMIGKIDALLLARDDAENHYRMALPFLEAGVPIFIDKPMALSVKEAEKIFHAQTYPNQIFSCSSLRYAGELFLDEADFAVIDKVVHVEASVPKAWNTYSVHVIEPIILNLPNRGPLEKVTTFDKNGIRSAYVEWQNVSANIIATGPNPAPISLTFYGSGGITRKTFKDSYSCFKKSLASFIHVVTNEVENIPRQETMEIIKIIEEGGR